MGDLVNLRRFGTEAGNDQTVWNPRMNSNLVVLISFSPRDYDASLLRFLRKSDQGHFLGSNNGFDLVTRIHPTRKKSD